ncbi:hypothetical protein ABC502_00105 [Alkalimonas sp. NCh-2]|uniref:hypothetical protein n=1 Tax=Alkalimonas sp. NCh-2 TaxID=3144846 RepID=UPI0031F6F4B0
MSAYQTEGMSFDAISFYRAAHMCSHKGLGVSSDASLMCAAFSIELALKAILTENGLKPWGHKIKPLLTMLPPQLFQQVEIKLRSHWPDFDVQLDDCNEAFVNWRYKYESKHPMKINSFFILELAELCCRLVISKFNIRCTPDIPKVRE